MAGFSPLKLKYNSKTMGEWETIVILEKQLLKKSKKDNYFKDNCVILGAYIQLWKRICSFESL